jgi:hypothetical protein
LLEVSVRSLRLLSGVLLLLLYGAVAQAQTPTAGVTAPAFVRLDGDLRTLSGEPRTGTVVLVVSLYASQTDSAPVWSEEQTIALDASGHYAIFAGATQPDGLPRQFFTAEGAQWIGVAVQGEPEQPRVRILSVPYALSAGNADTLGGVSAKDFVMSENLAESVKKALDGSEGGTAIGGAGDDPGALGLPNRLAKFAGDGNPTANSIVFDNGSVIGINNDGATAKLDVNGVIRATSLANFATNGAGMEIAYNPGATIGVIQAYDRSASAFRTIFLDGFSLGLNAQSGGKVGVNTSTPSSQLDVQGVIRSTSVTGIPTSGAGVEILYGGGAGVIHAYDRAAAYRPLSIDGSTLTLNLAGGNVGIGVAAPTTKLHVGGDVTVNGNIGAKYQDVAEWVETDEVLEPGTVVIVDPNAANRVVPSASAYDTRAAGAVSRQPGLILGERGEGNKSMVAQSGRVVIKVDATYGAIKPGDLLVTSPTPGHAMLSKPIKIGKQLMHRPGTLVGKALEALPNGKGEILVLLTLQ